jgi:hypothetical protein
MTLAALTMVLMVAPTAQEPKVLDALAHEAAVMQAWGCAGRTNPAIAPAVTAAYEKSRQAALAFVAAVSAEIKRAIDAGGSELQVKPEVLADAARRVGSARRGFFGLLFNAEIGEAARACGSLPSLESYDCTKTKDIITCIAASDAPFSTLPGFMLREASRGKTEKERRSFLNTASAKILERIWKTLP